MVPVFDGHNDFLLRVWNDSGRRHQLWTGDDGHGHIDVPRLRKGGFAGECLRSMCRRRGAIRA